MKAQPTDKYDIPKIFWKYFDLYRRKKISLEQYVESTRISIYIIEKFLEEATGKTTKIIENAEEV